MQQSEVLLIGNKPIKKDIRALVENTTNVVRFNFCQGLPQHLGTKCTDLWLSSRGKQAKRLSLQFPAINQATLNNVVITDPKPSPLTQQIFQLIKRRSNIDYGEQICKNLSSNTQIKRISNDVRQLFLVELMTFGHPKIKPYAPSSGTLAIKHFLERYEHIAIAGFGFQGWKRHPWQQEQAFVNKLTAEGRINVIDN